MNIDDIAKLANVSKSAVSLALNGKQGVSKQTRDKILKIAEEHGYKRRSFSKEESTSRSNFLRFVACTNTGIVSEQYQSLSFFMALINNIDNISASKGYSLIISSINSENLEKDIFKLENEQRSSGIILLGTNLTNQQIKIVERCQPNLVVLDTCSETENIDFIVMNNTLGARQAGKHLINLGHTKIGYVESNSRIYNFEKRKEGFLNAINENGLTIGKENFYKMFPTVVSSQEEFKQKIMKNKNNLPTALFCECDYMAISVIKSLTELNIKVPEDISVIGFDNIFETQVVSPELTTIHVRVNEIASVGVSRLIDKIEKNDDTSMKIFIDTEVVERKSTIGVQSLQPVTTK
ncbi:LacI family DNA-binding transcriptional regulator [Evansella sp. AB-P1]|uniref:LacI family DNA-binding transcriptional regulator n=1 Tax=Evansella sp. AB-P1 TaxID=3037653 RepID=UPI00241CC85E|nr:LacI family DNA-binding transcriptional regulator [Evansella sp. AB-P1]MDG5789898.1 LacI family DNA-binding transcriptional regulator [Evansella sp. AB-P1]